MSKGFPGILLLTMGGPPRLEDVRPFLFNLFRDPLLFRIPLGGIFQTPFALLVSAIRTMRVRKNYLQIGGGSPLGEITQSQASCLEKDLASRGYPFPVAVALRYWKPDAGEAVGKVLEKGADRLIALPLYPQYSRATTGSSLHQIDAVVKGAGPGVAVKAIESWWNHPGYLACLARRVLKALDQVDWGPHTGLLFLAHGLPQRFVEEGDPYVKEVMGTIQGILSMVAKQHAGNRIPWYLAYQSRVGPLRWVGPFVGEVLGQMITQGFHKIIVIPVSFVSDHLETLYEIDILYRRLAYQNGASAFVRIEALNDAPDFIKCLTDIVIQEGL